MYFFKLLMLLGNEIIISAVNCKIVKKFKSMRLTISSFFLLNKKHVFKSLRLLGNLLLMQ